MKDQEARFEHASVISVVPQNLESPVFLVNKKSNIQLIQPSDHRRTIGGPSDHVVDKKKTVQSSRWLEKESGCVVGDGLVEEGDVKKKNAETDDDDLQGSTTT